MSVQLDIEAGGVPAGKDIFISYSRESWKWVNYYLIRQLEAAKLTFVVDDRDFKIGELIEDNITRGISSCRYTLLVMTPEWVRGRWTHFEGVLAVQGDPSAKEGKILAIKLKECEVPSHFGDRLFLDISKIRERDDKMAELLRQLGVCEERLKLARESVAKKTLQTLIELTSDPDVRKVVAALSEEFEQIVARNSIVTLNKTLHDDLQTIQLMIKQVDRDSAALSAAEVKSWSNLRMSSSALRGRIKKFVSKITKSDMESTDVLFAESLERFAEDLHAAAHAEEAERFRSILELVASEVDRELPMVNDRIIRKLAERPLQSLIKSLADIYKEICTFDFDEQAIALLAELRLGIETLTETDLKIRELVFDHNLFQQIEVKLNIMWQGGKPTYGRIHSYWKYVASLAKGYKLVEHYTAVLSVRDELTALLDEIDGVRDDAYAANIEECFLRFVDEVFVAFNEVDIELKAECEGLEGLGPKLERLLTRMQTDE